MKEGSAAAQASVHSVTVTAEPGQRGSWAGGWRSLLWEQGSGQLTTMDLHTAGELEGL